MFEAEDAAADATSTWDANINIRKLKEMSKHPLLTGLKHNLFILHVK